MTQKKTRRGFTQKTKNAVIQQRIIPTLVSGSSTPAINKQQQPQQALKTLKRVQGLSDFITARRFTQEVVLKNCHCQMFLSGMTPYFNPPSPALRAPSPSKGGGNRGFTLIELLVVVLIIGILAAVALPQYNKAVIKSRFAEIETNMQTLAHAAQRYYLEHDAYATDISQLDVEIPECHCIPEVCTTCEYGVGPSHLKWITEGDSVSGIWMSNSFFALEKDYSSCGKNVKKWELRASSSMPKRIRDILGFTDDQGVNGCVGYRRP